MPMKETKEDLSKYRDIPSPCFGRLNIVKISTLSKWISNFNAIPMKIPTRIFCRHKQVYC